MADAFLAKRLLGGHRVNSPKRHERLRFLSIVFGEELFSSEHSSEQSSEGDEDERGDALEGVVGTVEEKDDNVQAGCSRGPRGRGQDRATAAEGGTGRRGARHSRRRLFADQQLTHTDKSLPRVAPATEAPAPAATAPPAPTAPAAPAPAAPPAPAAQRHKFADTVAKYWRFEDKYCELCHAHFQGPLKDHLAERQHLAQLHTPHLYREVDRVISKLPSVETFLKSVHSPEHHTQQQEQEVTSPSTAFPTPVKKQRTRGPEEEEPTSRRRHALHNNTEPGKATLSGKTGRQKETKGRGRRRREVDDLQVLYVAGFSLPEEDPAADRRQCPGADVRRDKPAVRATALQGKGKKKKEGAGTEEVVVRTSTPPPPPVSANPALHRRSLRPRTKVSYVEYSSSFSDEGVPHRSSEEAEQIHAAKHQVQKEEKCETKPKDQQESIPVSVKNSRTGNFCDDPKRLGDNQRSPSSKNQGKSSKPGNSQTNGKEVCMYRPPMISRKRRKTQRELRKLLHHGLSTETPASAQCIQLHSQPQRTKGQLHRSEKQSRAQAKKNKELIHIPAAGEEKLQRKHAPTPSDVRAAGKQRDSYTPVSKWQREHQPTRRKWEWSDDVETQSKAICLEGAQYCPSLLRFHDHPIHTEEGRLPAGRQEMQTTSLATVQGGSSPEHQQETPGSGGGTAGAKGGRCCQALVSRLLSPTQRSQEEERSHSSSSQSSDQPSPPTQQETQAEQQHGEKTAATKTNHPFLSAISAMLQNPRVFVFRKVGVVEGGGHPRDETTTIPEPSRAGDALTDCNVGRCVENPLAILTTPRADTLEQKSPHVTTPQQATLPRSPVFPADSYWMFSSSHTSPLATAEVDPSPGNSPTLDLNQQHHRHQHPCRSLHRITDPRITSWHVSADQWTQPSDQDGGVCPLHSLDDVSSTCHAQDGRAHNSAAATVGSEIAALSESSHSSVYTPTLAYMTAVGFAEKGALEGTSSTLARSAGTSVHGGCLAKMLTSKGRGGRTADCEVTRTKPSTKSVGVSTSENSAAPCAKPAVCYPIITASEAVSLHPVTKNVGVSVSESPVLPYRMI